MKEIIGRTFLDDLFGFLDGLIDTGTEVHIVDKSDPDNVVEHVFNSDEDDDLPFDDEECVAPCPASSCNVCPHSIDCEECIQYDLECEDYEPDMWGIPDVRRVVFSEPATIVFWEDNTKTVVKCMKGEKFERYAGFIAACAKKMFGSTSRAKAIMNECAEDQVPAEPKKKKGVKASDITRAVNEVNANSESIKEAINEALG